MFDVVRFGHMTLFCKKPTPNIQLDCIQSMEIISDQPKTLNLPHKNIVYNDLTCWHPELQSLCFPCTKASSLLVGSPAYQGWTAYVSLHSVHGHHWLYANCEPPWKIKKDIKINFNYNGIEINSFYRCDRQARWILERMVLHSRF